MSKNLFVPVAGVIPRSKNTIKVGDVVGCVKGSASTGYIGVVDHIYKNASKVKYYVVRFSDGSSDNMPQSTRFYDIDSTNKKLREMLDHNNEAVEALKGVS